MKHLLTILIIAGLAACSSTKTQDNKYHLFQVINERSGYTTAVYNKDNSPSEALVLDSRSRVQLTNKETGKILTFDVQDGVYLVENDGQLFMTVTTDTSSTVYWFLTDDEFGKMNVK